MPEQDERNPLPKSDGAILKELQKDRPKQEEKLRELESRIAELEEKEKYSKIACEINPRKTDKGTEDYIIERLSKIIEVRDGK